MAFLALGAAFFFAGLLADFFFGDFALVADFALVVVDFFFFAAFAAFAEVLFFFGDFLAGFFLVDFLAVFFFADFFFPPEKMLSQLSENFWVEPTRTILIVSLTPSLVI